MRDINRIQSVADARHYAQRRLPKALFQMYEGGVNAGQTLHDNIQAYTDVRFVPRAARFSPTRSIGRRVLGFDLSMPVILSSVGGLGIGHSDGEAAVARAAGEAGVLQFVSGVASTPIEQIMRQAAGPVFYQFYYIGGREASAPILERARRAGCHGLVLTVDAPVPPPMARELPPRERRSLPGGAGLRDAISFAPQLVGKTSWLSDFVRHGRNTRIAMALGADGRSQPVQQGLPRVYEQVPVWEDLPWIRDRWEGPLVIKGLLTVEDAERAVAEGVDAIVVSNHGGNSLDGSISPLQALPDIAAAVGDRIEVLADSGVRRGADVVKAVALGAHAVGLGRAYVYGLLAAGGAGVSRILDLFHEDIDRTVALLGAASIDEIDRSYVDAPYAGADREEVLV